MLRPAPCQSRCSVPAAGTAAVVAGGVASASDNGMISSISKGEDRQRSLPAEIVDHGNAERREQELPERSRGGSGAERQAPPLRRQQLAECGQHQIERTAG